MLDTMNVQNKLNDLVELMKLQMETGISFCGREYFLNLFLVMIPLKLSVGCFRRITEIGRKNL